MRMAAPSISSLRDFSCDMRGKTLLDIFVVGAVAWAIVGAAWLVRWVWSWLRG